MKRIFSCGLLLCNITLILGTGLAMAAVPEKEESCTLELNILGIIGPATSDYVERALEVAKAKNCVSIYLRMNTPGGNLSSTRKIVEMIMNSQRPFLCLISPSGGRAGSAGAIIMQACHVSGALEATHLGAATPVSSQGQDLPEAMKIKVYEDTRSWVEGLAKYRNRSVEFARAIVVDGKALDAREAFRAGAIDGVFYSESDFLKFAVGRRVRLNQEKTSEVPVGLMESWEPDLRYQVLDVVSHPQWAYLVFMASLGLIYFELTHPGIFAPGVIGAIGLVLSMINFHILDVSWGAVALIFLGIAFVFAELFVPSFGALGLGGAAALFMGSLFLFNPLKSGVSLPLPFILAVSCTLAMFSLGLTYFAYQAIKQGENNRKENQWVGKTCRVQEFHSHKGKGYVVVAGELWQCISSEKLTVGQIVKINRVNGLHLEVSGTEEES